MMKIRMEDTFEFDCRVEVDVSGPDTSVGIMGSQAEDVRVFLSCEGKEVEVTSLLGGRSIEKLRERALIEASEDDGPDPDDARDQAEDR